MKILYQILLLVFLLIITSCSILSQLSNEEKGLLLEKNLSEWDEIRLDGVITLNFEQYTFRKNFVIKKNNLSARIDVIDKGFWGLNLKPFFSAYIDSLLYLRLPNQTDIQILEINNSNFLNFNNLLKDKNRIIRNYEIEKDEITYFFSKSFQVTQISNSTKQFSILLNYDQLDKLTEINIEIKNKQVAHLEIDKLSHKNNKIKKLK
ncbi:MAG: hypothetical protein K8S23_04270 [Candidatus Cloacimonetes bacterium]|nr:hypothetical protein [Candidatus Cloacimonadota bacterium]